MTAFPHKVLLIFACISLSSLVEAEVPPGISVMAGSIASRGNLDGDRTHVTSLVYRVPHETGHVDFHRTGFGNGGDGPICPDSILSMTSAKNDCSAASLTCRID